MELMDRDLTLKTVTISSILPTQAEAGQLFHQPDLSRT